MFNFLKKKTVQQNVAPIAIPRPHSIPEAIRLSRIEFDLYNDSRPAGMPLMPTTFYVRGVGLSFFVNSISFQELKESVAAAGYTMLLAVGRSEIKVTIIKSVNEYRRNESLRFK